MKISKLKKKIDDFVPDIKKNNNESYVFSGDHFHAIILKKESEWLVNVTTRSNYDCGEDTTSWSNLNQAFSYVKLTYRSHIKNELRRIEETLISMNKFLDDEVYKGSWCA